MKKLWHKPSWGSDPQGVAGSPKRTPIPCVADLISAQLASLSGQLLVSSLANSLKTYITSRKFLRAWERTVSIPVKYSGPEALGQEPWDVKGGSKA